MGNLLDKGAKAIFTAQDVRLMGYALSAVIVLAALLLALGIVYFVLFRGHTLEIGAVKFHLTKPMKDLLAQLDVLGASDRLKRNVLLTMRDELKHIAPIVLADIDHTRAVAAVNVILRDVTAALARGFDDRHRAAVWFRNEQAQFHMFAGHGFREQAVADATLSDSSIVARIYRRERTERIPNVSHDPDYEEKPGATRKYYSLLLVPVRSADEQTIAVLCVDAESENYFEEDDEFLCSCFAELCGILLSRLVRRTAA